MMMMLMMVQMVCHDVAAAKSTAEQCGFRRVSCDSWVLLWSCRGYPRGKGEGKMEVSR